MKICSDCMRCYEDEFYFCTEKDHDSLTNGRPGSNEIISNYRLDVLIEINEIGETYQATNTISDQLYVIRIIGNDLTVGSPQVDQQLRHELQTFTGISHPNLIRVRQTGLLSTGEHYIISETLAGQTLRKCLENIVPLSEKIIVNIAGQIAEGLEALHAAGLLHRNICPDNVILTTNPENRLSVKIQNIDFGSINQEYAIGRASSCPDLQLLKYFSPEQCTPGQSIEATSDIYSLGAILYEMLAGKPPFNAVDSADFIYKLLNEQPAPVQISAFDIRALLTHTLSLALQKRPDQRLKSANTFARQLRHIEQLSKYSSTPPPAAAQAPLQTASQVISPKYEINQMISPVSAEIPDGQPVSNSIKPILIKWEQPEDIPTECETSAARSAEANQTELAGFAFSSEEVEFITASLEPQPDLKVDNKYPDSRPESHLAHFLDKISPGYFVDNYPKLISGGLIGLLALFILGVILNRQFQTSNTLQSKEVAQSAVNNISPKSQEISTLTKESPVSTEKPDSAIFVEESAKINDSDETIPQIPEPDKTGRVKPQKVSLLNIKPDKHNERPKETPNAKPDLKEKVIPAKEMASANAKKSQSEMTKEKAKSAVDKKPVVAKQSSPIYGKDGSIRPRVVKTTRVVRIIFF